MPPCAILAGVFSLSMGISQGRAETAPQVEDAGHVVPTRNVSQARSVRRVDDKTSAAGKPLAAKDGERKPLTGSTPENITVSSAHQRVWDTTSRRSNTRVIVVPGEKLMQTGQVSVISALEQLSPSISVPSSSTGTNGFIRTLQMRGLSADQVLILVNGKRRHISGNFNVIDGPNTGTEPADISLIPMSAIDHIEVINDGATALYGQEAIAGAINIVLKDKRKGGSLHIQDSGYYAGDGVGINGYGDYAVSLGKTGGYLDFAAQITHQQPTNRSGLTSQANPLGPDVNRALGIPRSMLETVSVNGAIPLGNHIEFYTTDTYGHRDVSEWVLTRLRDDTSNVRALYPYGFTPIMTMDENDFQVNGGLRGTHLLGWDWDAFVTYGRDDDRIGMTNTLNATFGTASPTQFYDNSTIAGELQAAFKLKRRFTSAFIPGETTVELGGGYRHDTFQVLPGEYASYANGGVRVLDGPSKGALATPGANGHPGISPAYASDTGRDIYEGYANVAFHPVKGLEVSLGGRVSNYSDMTTVETGTAGFRYEFNPRYAIRGNIGTGYRPPTLGQMNYYSVLYLPTYSFLQMPSASASALALGSQPLSGEYSRNYSFGIDATPVDGWHVSGTLYRIAINDRMANSTKFSGTGVAKVLASIGLPTVQQAQYYINLGDTLTNGGELETDYTTRLGAYGTLRFQFDMNIYDTEVTRFAQAPSVISSMGLQYFNPYAQVNLLKVSPRNKENLTATWTWKKLSITVQEQRYGNIIYIVTPTDPSRLWTTVRPTFLTNINISYDIDRHWNVAVGADNIGNKYPTRTNRAATGPTNVYKYPIISPFGFSGGYYYASLAYRF